MSFAGAVVSRGLCATFRRSSHAVQCPSALKEFAQVRAGRRGRGRQETAGDAQVAHSAAVYSAPRVRAEPSAFLPDAGFERRGVLIVLSTDRGRRVRRSAIARFHSLWRSPQEDSGVDLKAFPDHRSRRGRRLDAAVGAMASSSTRLDSGGPFTRHTKYLRTIACCCCRGDFTDGDHAASGRVSSSGPPRQFFPNVDRWTQSHHRRNSSADLEITARERRQVIASSADPRIAFCRAASGTHRDVNLFARSAWRPSRSAHSRREVRALTPVPNAFIPWRPYSDLL